MGWYLGQGRVFQVGNLFYICIFVINCLSKVLPIKHLVIQIITMGIFSSLQREQRQAIGLLSIGTFLEYFDFFLYAHMAVLLNELFFPKADTHSQALLSALAFSSAFVFRPIGALLFGYIGDTYGRKTSIMITTFMMAVTCVIMANAPTYAQVGITAAWIVTICRMFQGMSSLGEIVGAQLFLTEAIPSPAKYPAVGLINVFADMGATSAVVIAALSTGYGFNWRIAFWIGAGVALVGSVARTTLRESPEFADAKRRIKNIAERANEDPKFLEKSPFYTQKVSKKTSWAYFGIMCTGPTFLYFTYFYTTNILKNTFGYNAHQILIHNLQVGVIQLFGWAILRTYLSSKIYPLKILQFAWTGLLIFVPFLPWLLNHTTAPWHLSLIQIFIILFRVSELPAAPIFFKNFPVFKRFSYTSLLYALAYSLVFLITSLGLTYLIEYLGYWGLLLIMLPALFGYGFGLNHFKQLEIAAGRYPQKTASQPQSGLAA
jgi:MHS family proline/betaine transporter-like MFS transporter